MEGSKSDSPFFAFEFAFFFSPTRLHLLLWPWFSASFCTIVGFWFSSSSWCLYQSTAGVVLPAVFGFLFCHPCTPKRRETPREGEHFFSLSCDCTRSVTLASPIVSHVFPLSFSQGLAVFFREESSAFSSCFSSPPSLSSSSPFTCFGGCFFARWRARFDFAWTCVLFSLPKEEKETPRLQGHG